MYLNEWTHWSSPPVEFHRAHFCLQVKPSRLKNLKLKCSLISPQVVAQIPKVCYASQPVWTLVSALAYASLNSLPADYALYKPLLSIPSPASLFALHSSSVTLPAVAGEQSTCFNRSFPSLVSVFCFHYFQLFPNISPKYMKKDQTLRGTQNNSSDIPLNLKSQMFKEILFQGSMLNNLSCVQVWFTALNKNKYKLAHRSTK